MDWRNYSHRQCNKTHQWHENDLIGACMNVLWILQLWLPYVIPITIKLIQRGLEGWRERGRDKEKKNDVNDF